MRNSPYTATLSSRGQVVIPEPIRNGLGFPEGTTFIVIGRGDTIVLHRLKEPPWKSFEPLAKQAQTNGRHLELAMQSYTKAFKKLRELGDI